MSNAKCTSWIRFVLPVIPTFCHPIEICVVNTALESHIPHKFHLHTAQVIREILQRQFQQCFLEERPWQVILNMLCTVVAKDLIRKSVSDKRKSYISIHIKSMYEYLSDVSPRQNFKWKHDNFNQILLQNSENM